MKHIADFITNPKHRICNKNLAHNNKAVSELIGTVLLLAITVATFTTLVLLSSSYFTGNPSPSVNLIAYVDGENIIIEHQGGDSLSTNTNLIYGIGAQTIEVPLQGLEDTNSNNQWDLGEKVSYSASSIDSSINIRVSVVDTASNTAIFSGTLQDGLVITIDDDNNESLLPIAQWHLDENTGTIAYDAIGSNDGTINGATWDTGVSGSALRFNGTDDYIEVQDSSTLDLSSALSLEAWINPEGDGLSAGGMSGAVIDTDVFGDFGSEWGKINSLGNNIYAIVYEDWSNDGWIKTVQIQNDGTLLTSDIDSLEFDTSNGREPDLVHVSGQIYAIAYRGDSSDGYIATVQINADGTIENSVIDTYEFDSSACYYPEIIHISGTVFAIAYESNGNQGYITTVEINADGTIQDSIVDSYRFDSNGAEPAIIQISSDVYAVAYSGGGSDGFLKTLQIATDGSISTTALDSLEFDTTACDFPDIIHIADDIYAISYVRSWWTGQVSTIQITDSGDITNSVIDTYEFESSDAQYVDIEHVNQDIYAIAYLAQGDDGLIKTLQIQSDGSITPSILDSFEYDSQTAFYPSLLQIHDGTFAVAYTNQEWEGAIKTFSIDTLRGIYKLGAYGLDFNSTTASGFINDYSISASLASGWNHVVLTYDKENTAPQQKLYINGVLAASTPQNSDISTTTTDFVMGYNTEAVIDEVSLYDQALSLQEIQSNYEQGRPEQYTVINLSIRVASSNDDAEERISNGEMYQSSTDLELITDSQEQEVGIRFTGITIPQGSTIQSATLRFIIDEQETEATNLTIYAHDTDDSQAFSSTDYDITSRQKTTTFVTWDSLPALDVGEALESPNIATIIQEIVDKSGWNSGNSLSIIITGSGQRTVESYEGSSQNAPLLTIRYIEP